MADGPSFRVHPELGVLVKMPGQANWIWIFNNGRVQPGHANDKLAANSGWVDPLAEAQAALQFEISRRTLGGTPPPVDQNWANVTTVPDSATDDRMPAHRRVGLASSTSRVPALPVHEETV